jgi:hypothetical protein
LRASYTFQSGVRTDQERVHSKGADIRYLALVLRMESYFKGFKVEYIECNKNTKADDLAKAARNTPMPVDVFFRCSKTRQLKQSC